ncbi:MAG: FCD domain-containing protein, partial [Deltaproteobacteria bacterium]|nr:FCD domain-containing protein [Deltaproteobacteria bacterium]
ELRLLIDTGVADLAMQKATTEDIEKLERANRRLKSAAETLGDDSNSLRDLDLNFHMTLLEVTRNRLVAKLGRAIYTLFMASIEKSVKADPYKAYANHELVINAIKRRDRGLIKRITSESLRFWMATIDS